MFLLRESNSCVSLPHIQAVMDYIISGIQQIGIGIPDVHEAWAWYRKAFGMDLPMFDEAAEANLMLPYTGGEPRQRHAILAVNLHGGGGMEIWQYTSRTPEGPAFEPQLGDLGIYITKIKSPDVSIAYQHIKTQELEVLGEMQHDPLGNPHFFVKDPYGNLFQVESGKEWFMEGGVTGGPAGCMIGVTDIEKARKLYSDILGYDSVVYEREGRFSDFNLLPGGEGNFHRVLLKHSEARKGSFSKLFGPSQIELVVAKDRAPKKIFENRMWGDLGFIHLCFDISGMAELKATCEKNGFPFTVDSSDSFDMGEAAGHFSYIEDPDGTLIEFVETHKIPIMKKVGWYLDLRKRNREKPLPNWMLKALRFNRVKE